MVFYFLLWFQFIENECLVYAKKIRKVGEQNAIYYTRHISDLRYQRIHQSDNIEKLELLMKEHEFTTEMRKNGLYHSIGLYFQNVLELSLTGSDKNANLVIQALKDCQKLL